MVQATTPTFILTLPDTVNLTEANTIYFSLTQGATNIKKIVTADSPNVVSVYLTQAETLPLSRGIAKIQLNWVYSDGSRACTNIVDVNVAPNLLRAVIE